MLLVASYNIRKSVGTDWRRHPRRVLDVIAEIGADVVALQEVDRRFGSRESSIPPDVIHNETGYTPMSFGPRDLSLGWHGNTILVRDGTEIIDQKELHLPAFEPRGAVLADIRHGDEKVRVIGMHLGLIGFWRKRQSQALLDQLEELEHTMPTVMMGDLNEWSTEKGCLANFSRDHHVARPGPSYHSHWPVLAYDRIITTPDIEVVESGVHQSDKAREASDHLPVWARLKITPPA